MSLLIAGGRVVDPSQDLDAVRDVLIRGGRIARLGVDLPRDGVARVLDARGALVVPGLIDMHVQLREPGAEAAETIASGTAAAVRGGITAVAVMPNTDPVVDDEAAAEFQVLQGRRAGKARVYPVGAITRGREGEALAEMAGMTRGGAVGFSDYGRTVRSAEVFRCALLYAAMVDRVVIEQPEEPDLAKGGVVHGGVVGLSLGLSGKSRASETILVARDLALAELTRGRLHLAHVSTAGAVEQLRQAKQSGIRVTAGVTPHHLVLTDEAVASFDPNFKVRPPLRPREDVEALVEGILEGVIDVIASDHAPHSREKKEVEFQDAPDGVIGLETLLPLCATALVHQRGVSWSRLVSLLSCNPAAILGVDGGTLRPGGVADVTVIDPDVRWTIEDDFVSRSRNSPFVGWEVQGRATATLVGGEVVYERASP